MIFTGQMWNKSISYQVWWRMVFIVKYINIQDVDTTTPLDIYWIEYTQEHERDKEKWYCHS